MRNFRISCCFSHSSSREDFEDPVPPPPSQPERVVEGRSGVEEGEKEDAERRKARIRSCGRICGSGWGQRKKHVGRWEGGKVVEGDEDGE